MTDDRIVALNSRIAYANPWMRVREDEVRFPGGRTGSYGVVEKPDFAVVLPVEDDGFWLVQQFRYPVERREWEFPLGAWPAGRTGTALELAVTELAEETGKRATSWTHLGRLASAPGVLTASFDVFVADGLEDGEPDREPTEADMICEWRSVTELRAMIGRGEFRDAQSLAALALWQLHHGAVGGM